VTLNHDLARLIYDASLAQLIYDTSRDAEASISAAEANRVAAALLDAGWRPPAAKPDPAGWSRGPLGHLATVTTDSGVLAPSLGDDDDFVEHHEERLDGALLMAARHRGPSVAGPYYDLLLDLDYGDVTVLRSSSGNTHLIIAGLFLTKEQHDRAVDVLAEVGILQEGFARGAQRSKFGATLRLPWVKKGEDLTWSEQKAPGLDPARSSDNEVHIWRHPLGEPPEGYDYMLDSENHVGED
jgi:hypothetical protein